MKLVIISDTHGQHEKLAGLRGDVLIHCGDMETLFQTDPAALEKIDDWFGRQAFDHVICTGGNHDLTLEKRVRSGMSQPFRNATFLNGSEIVIGGIKFFGAPWVPDLRRHAFYADDAALAAAWAEIPDDVDVLITHTPPSGILDVSSRGLTLGCAHLRKRLKALAPRVHCFGHVHASAGRKRQGATTFVNASSVNSDFEIAHAPIEIDLSARRSGFLRGLLGRKGWR